MKDVRGPVSYNKFARKPDGFGNHIWMKKKNLRVKPDAGKTYRFLLLIGNQDLSSRHSFGQHTASLPASRRVSKGRYQSELLHHGSADQTGISTKVDFAKKRAYTAFCQLSSTR